jgi:predicted NBD/HSP70 family sugar kinase
MPEGSEAADIVAALADLRPGARELSEVGRYLGLGIATLVNLLNPRLLIVGGLLREVYPLVAEEVAAALEQAALAAPAEQLRVTVP